MGGLPPCTRPVQATGGGAPACGHPLHGMLCAPAARSRQGCRIRGAVEVCVLSFSLFFVSCQSCDPQAIPAGRHVASQTQAIHCILSSHTPTPCPHTHSLHHTLTSNTHRQSLLVHMWHHEAQFTALHPHTNMLATPCVTHFQNTQAVPACRHVAPRSPIHSCTPSPPRVLHVRLSPRDHLWSG